MSEPSFPRLKPRAHADADRIAAHQQARLRGAIVRNSVSVGYPRVTVRQLVQTAGVSTKTLYRHFGGKDGLLLSAFEQVFGRAAAQVAQAYRAPDGDPSWEASIGRGFRAYVALLLEHPAEARFALDEVLRAGPVAGDQVDACERTWARMLARGLDDAPGATPAPPLMARALVDGIWLASRTRLLDAGPRQAEHLGRDLATWFASHRLPPEAQALRAAWPVAIATGSPQGGANPQPRQRMQRAAAAAVAAAGRSGLSQRAIVESAAVTPRQFEAEFGSARECFLSSVELLCAEAFGLARRTAAGAADWGGGTCRVVWALLARTDADPVFARCLFVELGELDEEMNGLRATVLAAFAQALVRSAPNGARISPLCAEASAGAVWALVARHLARGRAARVCDLAGQASYLVLAPILGAGPALAVIARESRRSDGSSPRRAALQRGTQESLSISG